MISFADFHKVVYGWDVEFWKEKGVRYCVIFVKLTQSMNDMLWVQYIDFTKREVNAGLYLYTNLEDALQWIENEKQKELVALNFQKREIEAKIDSVYNYYEDIRIDEIPDVMPN